MISILLTRKIISLYIIVIAGATLVRSGLVKSTDSKILSLVALYLVQPCMILVSYQKTFSSDVVHGLLLCLTMSVGINILWLILLPVFGRILHLDNIEKASIMYSNAGNLILPLVSAILGDEWIIYASVLVSVQQILMWSHMRMLISGDKKVDLKKIFLNVNMISIMVGLLMFVFRIRIPSIVLDSMTSLSNMMGPICMLVTGMLIGGMDLRKVFSYKRLYLVTFMRLVGFSLIAVLVYKFAPVRGMAPDSDKLLLISLLGIISPVASSVVQFAQVYSDRAKAEYASAINVATTMFCVFTMPIMVFLFQL